MFTQAEENYIKALINTYKKQGYNYYLCHTITETNNNYDICLYVSKEEIKSISSSVFDLTNAIGIYIDSSQRNDNAYNPSIHSRDLMFDGNITTIVNVNDAEFIYTNAIYTYSETSTVVNPDLLVQGSESVEMFNMIAVIELVLIITFIYTFFANILRIRK